jgi:hypothetical protein
MNKNKFEKYVTKIMDYLDKDEPHMAFDEYKRLVDESAVTESIEPIVFRGRKGEYLLENSYLLEKLMDKTKNTIRLYVDNIDESSYGHLVVRNMLFNWLNLDKERKVKLLVRKGFDFLSSAFYHTNYKFIENKQIEVKTLRDKEKCSSYAGIFDRKAIKIKDKSSEIEVMVGSFSDGDKAGQMADIFDQVFAIAIPVRSKVMLAFSAFMKHGSITSDQKELIQSLANIIKNRVNDSSNSHLAARYARPIEL